MKKTITTNLTGIDIKAKIMEAVKDGIKIYEEECGRQTKFKEPLVGYANTSDPLFEMFFEHGLCKLPRKCYNPARAIIVFFLPYTDEVVESNRQSGEPSPEWIQAYHDSTWAIMKVHASIQALFNKYGRLSSLCNTPIDWNHKKGAPEWNFKMAAYVAGLGEVGPAGSIMTEAGPAGRFGAILTDVNLVPDKDYGFTNRDGAGLTPEMDAEFEKYMKASGYAGPCDEALIAACPGKAISPDGIDRKACQEYCMKIFKHVPTPDICGKCYKL